MGQAEHVSLQSLAQDLEEHLASITPESEKNDFDADFGFPPMLEEVLKESSENAFENKTSFDDMTKKMMSNQQYLSMYNKDGREAFFDIVAKLVEVINGNSRVAVEARLYPLVVAMGLEAGLPCDLENSLNDNVAGSTGDSCWDQWDGAEWVSAGIEGDSILELFKDAKDSFTEFSDGAAKEALLSVVEDIIKRASQLDAIAGLIGDKLTEALRYTLSMLLGSQVTEMVCAVPPLALILGLIALFLLHQKTSPKVNATVNKTCIELRADRISRVKGFVRQEDIDRTYRTHEVVGTDEARYALCTGELVGAMRCPFWSVSPKERREICSLADPPHLTGRETRQKKIERAMNDAVYQGRYIRRIDCEPDEYYCVI